MGVDGSVESVVRGAMVVVGVSGGIDVHTAAFLREELATVLDADPDLVVDLTGVTFMDSTGLGVLVSASKKACRYGGAPATGHQERQDPQELPDHRPHRGVRHPPDPGGRDPS